MKFALHLRGYLACLSKASVLDFGDSCEKFTKYITYKKTCLRFETTGGLRVNQNEEKSSLEMLQHRHFFIMLHHSKDFRGIW